MQFREFEQYSNYKKHQEMVYGYDTEPDYIRDREEAEEREQAAIEKAEADWEERKIEEYEARVAEHLKEIDQLPFQIEASMQEVKAFISRHNEIQNGQG